MNKKISIILCTYNEVNHIEKCISLVSKTLKNVEIIVVDDNSNDGTLEKLDKLKLNFNFKLFVFTLLFLCLIFLRNLLIL